MRDVARAAVYDAEDGVFIETLYTEPLGWNDVVELARRLFAHEWWVANVAVVPSVERARAGASTSYARCDGDTQLIRLTAAHQSCAILAHEAGHVAMRAMYGSAASHHGPEYRATMIDVTTVLCGPAAAARVAAAYRSAGLVVARRRGVAPAAGADRGIFGAWRLERALPAASA